MCRVTGTNKCSRYLSVVGFLVLTLGISGCSGEVEPDSAQNGAENQSNHTDGDVGIDDAGDSDATDTGESSNNGEDPHPYSDYDYGDLDDIDYESLDDAELLSQVLADVHCKVGWECYDSSMMGALLLRDTRTYLSADHCRIDRGTSSSWIAPLAEAALEAGRLAINRDYVEDCRDEMFDAYCDPEKTPSELDACNQAFEGFVEEGDVCLISYECEAGLICNNFDTDECYGYCEQPPEEQWGQPITDPDEDEDEDCGGEICDDDEFCAALNIDGDIEHVCQPRQPVGSSCYRDYHCQEDLFCTGNKCRSSLPGEGDPCDMTLDCDGDYVCVDDICQSPQPAEEGEECQESSGQRPCKPGLTCYQPVQDPDNPWASDPKTCREMGVEGDECTSGNDCYFDLYCTYSYGDEEPGECKPRPGLGEECSGPGTGNCQEGVCDEEDEVCVERKESGPACVHPDDE